MRKTINYVIKKNMFIVVLLIVLCPVLAVTYGTFIVSTDNYKVSEMYLSKLDYILKINDTLTSSYTLAPGETEIKVEVTTNNTKDTYYKLIYENNSNLLVSYARDEDWALGNILNKKIIYISIENTSNTNQTIHLDVIGGYITNELDDVIIPSGYTEIENTYYKYDYETIAMFIGDERVEELDSTKQYNLVDYTCTNGVIATYDKDTRKLTLTPGDKQTKCSLWFEEILTLAQKVLENISASTPTINYKQPSSSTNGEGLFKYTKITSPLISGQSNVIDDPTGTSQEDIYYYRGNITNNNIILGGYCWLIVRTTDTGGTKLLYNGPVQETEIKCPSYRITEPTNNEPLMNTGIEWNSTNYTDVRYAGSGPKNVLDNWYNTWITNNPEIEDKLEEIVWCNDVNNQTLLESNDGYPAKTRLYTNSTATPQLECKYASDRYTSKIGLLTADEAVLAGQVYNVRDNNKNSYINIYIKDWWLGSPYGSNGGYGFVSVSCGVDPYLNSYSPLSPSGVRGSVSLSPSISVTSGTGTTSDPYIVE